MKNIVLCTLSLWILYRLITIGCNFIIVYNFEYYYKREWGADYMAYEFFCLCIDTYIQIKIIKKLYFLWKICNVKDIVWQNWPWFLYFVGGCYFILFDTAMGGLESKTRLDQKELWHTSVLFHSVFVFGNYPQNMDFNDCTFYIDTYKIK